MRGTVKHSILILTAVLIAAVCILAAGMASAAVQSDGSFRYTVSSINEVTIVGAENSLSDEIVIPARIAGMPVVSIGGGAFIHNERITGVTIEDGISFIESEAFCACSALTYVVMPDSILCINEDAFRDCSNLSGVVISDSVSLIDDHAFDGCVSLPEVTLPSGVTEIGDMAFAGCTSLMSVNIEGQIQAIGEGAFRGCVSLNSIRIPGSVTLIGESAFRDCYSLTEVIYTGTRSQFNSMSVGDCNDELMDLRNWVLVSDFMELRFIDSAAGTVELSRADSDINGKVLIPGTVKGFTLISIGMDAFNGCEQLTGVILPVSVTHICAGAFSDCPSLIVVNYTGTAEQLSALVVDRGNEDFINATWYTVDEQEFFDKPVLMPFGYIVVEDVELGSYIIITESSSAVSGDLDIPAAIDGVPVRSISEDVFMDCDIENLYLHEGLQEIGPLAFAGCSSLTTATLPSSLQRIGMAAFDECDQLSTVYYGGTAAQAAQIDIDEYNDPLEDAAWVYGSNGAVYTVSFNANGGTGAPASQTKLDGVSLTLSSAAPAKQYTVTYNANGGTVSASSKKVSCGFSGWNTAQNGSGTSYQAGGVYTANADVTLYAQYTNPAAGTLAEPVRDGYSFAGWYTAADGGTRVTAATVITKNTVLYAHWGEIDNVAPFAAVQCTKNIAVRQTVTVTLLDNAGIAGYYWGNSSNYANNEFFATSDNLVSFYASKSGNFYLVAEDINGNVSEPVKVVFCKTTLDTNGGKLTPKYALTRQGSSIMLPVPTRTGYYFAGWYSAAEGGVKKSSYMKITTNSKIYAHWSDTDVLEPYCSVTATSKTAVRQTVTLNMRDNVGIAGYYWGKNKTYTDNEFTPASEETASFYVSQSGNYYLTVVDVNGLVSDTVQAVMCKTTFNANGGTVTPKYALALKSTSITLPTPTRSGYRFDGWYTAAEGGTRLDPVMKVTKNETIYAHWTQISN